MPKQTNQKALGRALFYIIEQNMPLKEAAETAGVKYRTLTRNYQKYLAQETRIKDGVLPKEEEEEPITVPIIPEHEINTAIHERAHFTKEIFRAKREILKRILVLTKGTKNIDALQRTLKTLDDLERSAPPQPSDMPGVNADTVNMFQFFNQKLIDDGYQGKPITDADIIEGD